MKLILTQPFSRFDLAPASSSVLGELDDNSSFYVTNISEKGFFASVITL